MNRLSQMFLKNLNFLMFHYYHLYQTNRLNLKFHLNQMFLNFLKYHPSH